MNKLLKTFKLVIVTGFILLISCTEKQPEQIKWETMRGVNIAPKIAEEDFQALKPMGANIARIAFATQPFMELEEPYNFNEDAFKNLDRILDLCEKYEIKLLIDPHRFPGTWHPWTMINNDKFWTDFSWHEKAISIWERIAIQCKDRGDVIAGYDLLNEPAVPKNFVEGSPGDINLLYRKLIAAIRKHDTKHTIMLAGPRYTPADAEEELPYINGLDILEAPVDDNLCYTIHMYDPKSFSHHGVWEESEFIKYPGFIDGEDWNQNKIREHMLRAKNFTEKYGVPMFIGEFSCPRWTGDYGNQYLKDQIEVYEEYGFSWAYHAFRENQLWDVEMNNYDKNDTIRVETTPRKELLIKAFSLNK
jgi:aryl-phospho-beta-D-glucosidase BglC (GH1 family)